MTGRFDSATTALLLIDMQNDFLHPEGAYGRAGQTSAAISIARRASFSGSSS